mgnify:CR=1 FL=1|jgi:creatinine amidohydrolase
MNVRLGLVALLAWTHLANAATNDQQSALDAALSIDRPIAALDSHWLEELTWVEVRDAIAAGKTTVIVPTGGIEQNGPYVALGKHNYILQSACPMLAEALGDALCAPIVKFVPEGGIDPPTGHMFFPGTISVRETTYISLLEDIVASLAMHGFTDIVVIADSGGNVAGAKEAVNNLNARPLKTGVRAYYMAEFYDNPGVIAVQESLGIKEVSEGYHDFYWATAMQMVTNPQTVRYEQRVAVGKASINGVSIAPQEKTIEVGRKLLRYRIDRTELAIRRAILERK